MFTTRKDAREAGWFSRRHTSRDAHDAARQDYLSQRGRAARQVRAQERSATGVALLVIEVNTDGFEKAKRGGKR